MSLVLRQSTAVDVLIGPFVDITDGSTSETGESPSVKLSKNGQTLAAKNDATTPTHDADGYYNCELDATDTNTVGTLVLTVAASANALPVRHEYQVIEEAVYDDLYTSGATGYPIASEIADAVFDESSSGHQTTGTFGRQLTLAGAIIVDTTITGTPTSTTYQLTSGSSVDDFYNDELCYIASGTGIGQSRVILDYTGSTKTVEVSEAFATTPAAADQVIIRSSHVHPVSQIATAVNAEVVDALNVDTYSEPGQGAPTATPSIRQMLHYLYKAWRNRNTSDATNGHRVYADDGSTVDHEASISDNGTTFDRGEFGSG